MTHTHLAAVISMDQARQTRREREIHATIAASLVTTAQIAAHFVVGPRTIRRWTESLGMPYTQLYEHGSLGFHVPSCDEWFRRIRQACAEPTELYARGSTARHAHSGGEVPSLTYDLEWVDDEPWITRSDLEQRMEVVSKTIQRYEQEGMPCGGPPRGGVRYKARECLAWREQRCTRDQAQEAPAAGSSTPSQAFARPSRGKRAAPAPPEPLAAPAPPAARVAADSVSDRDLWVGVAVAARYLTCTEAHIEFLVTLEGDAQLPHRREGQRLLFKLAHIDAWLDRKAAG